MPNITACSNNDGRVENGILVYWNVSGKRDEDSTSQHTRFSWNKKTGDIQIHSPRETPKYIGLRSLTEKGARKEAENWAQENLVR